MIEAKTGALKNCSDTSLMVLLHGVFQGQIPPPKLSSPHIIFSAHGVIQSVSLSVFFLKTALHIRHAPKESYELLPMNYVMLPCISDKSFQLQDMLPLPQFRTFISNTRSKNLLFNSVGVKVSQFNQLIVLLLCNNMGCYFQSSITLKYLKQI